MENSFKIPFTQQQAKKIVSNDDMRPAMGGVYYDNKNKCFVLTDGHKLVKVEINNEDMLPAYSFIIPLQALPKNKKEIETNSYEYDHNEKKVVLNHIDYVSKYDVIDERYPNYESVTPQSDDKTEISGIGVNFKLIEDTNVFLKAFNTDFNAVELEFYGASRAIKFKNLENGEYRQYNYSGLIMPVKLNN